MDSPNSGRCIFPYMEVNPYREVSLVVKYSNMQVDVGQDKGKRAEVKLVTRPHQHVCILEPWASKTARHYFEDWMQRNE